MDKRLINNQKLPPLLNDFLKEEYFYSIYNYYLTAQEDITNEILYLNKNNKILPESLDILKLKNEMLKNNLESLKIYYFNFKEEIDQLLLTDTDYLKENMQQAAIIRQTTYDIIFKQQEIIINLFNSINDNLNNNCKNIKLNNKESNHYKILEYETRTSKMLDNAKFKLTELSFYTIDNKDYNKIEDIYDQLYISLNNLSFEISLYLQTQHDYKIEEEIKKEGLNKIEKEFNNIKDQYNNYCLFIKKVIDEDN